MILNMFKPHLAIFLFLCFIAGSSGASDFSRCLELAKSNITILSDLKEAFTNFLHRALEEDGTYVRDLLVSKDVIPIPQNNLENSLHPKDLNQNKPSQIQFDAEIREHFKNHIELLLESEVEYMNALRRVLDELINEWEVKKECLENDSSNKLVSEENEVPDFLNSEYSDVDSNDIWSSNKDRGNKEAKDNRNEGATTDYINFLTGGTKSYSKSVYEWKKLPERVMNLRNEDHFVVETGPFTEDYVDYLKTEDSEVQPPAVPEVENVISVEYPEQTAESLEKLKYWVESHSLQDPHQIESVEIQQLESTDENNSGDIPTLDIPPTETYEFLEQVSDTDDPLDNFLQWVETEFPLDPSEIDENNIEKFDSEAVTESLEPLLTDKPAESQRKRLQQHVTYEPGKYYLVPNYEDIPRTRFTCKNKPHIPGFYADEETHCQVFHVCWPGRRESFLCPTGTTFNQALLACDRWYNSNCSIAQAYFDVNAAFKEGDFSEGGTTSAMVDSLIDASQQSEMDRDPETITDQAQIDELYEADVHFSESLAKGELSKIWKFLPTKAKVFAEQPPELQEYLAQVHEQKISKSSTTTAVSVLEKAESDRIIRLKNMKLAILKVLEDLAKHQRSALECCQKKQHMKF